MLENTLTYSIFSQVAFFDSLKIYFQNIHFRTSKGYANTGWKLVLKTQGETVAFYLNLRFLIETQYSKFKEHFFFCLLQ